MNMNIQSNVPRPSDQGEEVKMLKLSPNTIVKEVAEKNQHPYKVDLKGVGPDVVDAKDYINQSAFIKNSVFYNL